MPGRNSPSIPQQCFCKVLRNKGLQVIHLLPDTHKFHGHIKLVL